MVLTTLLKFKIKEYFGSVRASKGSFFVALLGLLWLNAVGLIAGLSLPQELLITDTQILFNALAAFLSAYLAVFLLLSMRGGMTAFQAELDFLMTSSISPGKYLMADLIFQFVSVHVFFSPMIPFVLSTGWRLGVSLGYMLLGLGVYEAYLVMGLMLMQGMGVVGLRWPTRWMTVLVIALIGAIIFPSLSLAGLSPYGYSDVPLPATFVSQQLVSMLSGLSVQIDALTGFLVYLLGASIFYGLVTRLNFFPDAKPTVAISFGEVSFRARSLQTKRLIGGLGPVTTSIGLNYSKGGSVGFLIRKELIRVVRDGSLLMIMLIFAIYSVIGLASTSFPQQTGEAVAGPLFSLVIYSALIPTMLAASWSTSERDNLWIVLTSGQSVSEYFRALFTVFAALAIVIPLGLVTVIAVLTTPPSPWLPFAALSVSCFSSALSIYAQLRFGSVKQGAFSTTHLLTIFFSMAGAFLFSSPFLAVMTISDTLSILAQILSGALLLSYLGVTIYFLISRIDKEAIKMEI